METSQKPQTAPAGADAPDQPLLTQDLFTSILEREHLNLTRAEYMLRMLGRAFSSRAEPIPADEALEVLDVVIDVVRQAINEVEPETGGQPS